MAYPITKEVIKASLPPRPDFLKLSHNGTNQEIAMPITQDRMIALIEEADALDARDAAWRQGLQRIIKSAEMQDEGARTALEVVGLIDILISQLQPLRLQALIEERLHFRKVQKKNEKVKIYLHAKRREAGVRQAYGPVPRAQQPQSALAMPQPLQTMPTQPAALPSWSPEMAEPRFPLVIGPEDIPARSAQALGGKEPTLPPGVEIQEDPATMAPDDVLAFLGLADKGQK